MVKTAVEALAVELAGVFGNRLRSVVLYGEHAKPAPHHGGPGWGQHLPAVYTLALVDRLDLSDLERCASLSDGWRRRNLVTPLLLTPAEFERTLDAFPLEYGDILSTHQVIWGADPFESLAVAVADLRRACEAQAKSHLLHLREGFMEAGGHGTAVGRLIVFSVPALRALLGHVSRLHTPQLDGGVLPGGKPLTLDEPVVGEILALTDESDLPATEVSRVFAQYLDFVERLARALDRWTA